MLDPLVSLVVDVVVLIQPRYHESHDFGNLAFGNEGVTLFLLGWSKNPLEIISLCL
ncbi:hypothetical protein D3C76_1754350 [compost metagenome]